MGRGAVYIQWLGDKLNSVATTSGCLVCNLQAVYCEYLVCMCVYSCRVEFERRNQALDGDPETRRRFHTYVVFLGELYLNLEV